ncbi:PAS domain S-box protein [Funiculus sociatus GB2-A5]|uniref:histidine kinase n=1 Tax=Funiculus sociatus GB2-A5 TaxID=2933946 RepID=A0ABV0JYM8_9CYAN|nr:MULTISPECIES: PAS domain S-box protein [unclassified Trichocoleus]MBD1905098.1 PAS domain S-box protein [Trichocoleus sp. FACHB-832]MBD2062632.1 PAS domain S-box protein [Trichocoleus sp. FACHB-6]
MKWSQERKIIAGGFGLAMLILSIVSTASYQNTTKLFQRQKRVEKTYQVLQEIRDVLTTLRDAERARRGYIITGKELYLVTYNTAIKEINPKFNQVRRETADNLNHQRSLDIIEPLIAQRVTLIKKSVELYKQNKSDTATQIELTDKGIMIHDEIWKIIAQMEGEEQLLLQRRAEQSEASFQDTMLLEIVGSFLSFSLLFGVYSLLYQQIKKRQRVEDILRESEQRYRNLFQLHPYPLWVFDLETLSFLAVNDAAINDYGYSQVEFLSMTIKDICPPEDLPVFLDKNSVHFSQVKQAGVWRHQKQDGTPIYVEITAHELVFAGRQARLMLARDITQEKQAQEALQASEEKFRQIAENIHEIFWMSDDELHEVLYVNPVYEEIWGRTCENLYANPKSFINAVHPEDRDRVIANLEQNAKKEFDIEYRIMRPDESVRWVWDRCFPIKNAAGEVYRRAGVTQDITERKQAEEIRRTLEKEREINELKLRFFSMASHEFRTPLSTILISAQLLENSSKEWSEEKKLKNLYRIQSAAKTMTQLLTDILTLTRAESGKLEFNPEPLNIENFCQSLVEEIEFSTRAQQNIFFISQCVGKSACMDEKLLRSIFTNLLSNAIKYSPEDSHIYFILSYELGEAVFQIQDKGIGISPEDQELLYQSFHRGKNVGDVAGTGLGLAVVKKCVELHGGSIAVESKVGRGTTFTVAIPWDINVSNNEEKTPDD